MSVFKNTYMLLKQVYNLETRCNVLECMSLNLAVDRNRFYKKLRLFIAILNSIQTQIFVFIEIVGKRRPLMCLMQLVVT